MAIGTPVFINAGSNSLGYTSPPFTASVGNILWAWVVSSDNTAYPTTISISDSLGLTWHLVNTVDGPNADPFLRGALYWAEATGVSMTVSSNGGGSYGTYQSITAVPMGVPSISNIGFSSSATGDPAPSITLGLPNILINPDFSSSWDLTSTTLTPFSADSPMGTATAAKLTDTADLTYHKTSQINACDPTSLEYTFSIICRPFNVDQRHILIGIESPPGTANYVEACFNLNDGTFRFSETAGVWSGFAYSITALSDGFYRCAIKGLSGTGTSTIQVNIYMAQFIGANPTEAVVYGAGDGSSLLIVNPRLVQGDEL